MAQLEFQHFAREGKFTWCLRSTGARTFRSDEGAAQACCRVATTTDQTRRDLLRPWLCAQSWGYVQLDEYVERR
jgi:hypothetical protein